MKYIFGVLGFIALLILVVFFIFNRGDDSPVQENDAPTALVDYADKDSSVTLTTYGPLVGDDERRAVRIVITPVERRIEILTGYDEAVIDTQTYTNTKSGYENFLSALNVAGFANKKDAAVEDERGVCPDGNRYTYVLAEDSEVKSRLWSVSCGKLGSLAGNAPELRKLFQQQIPDYRLLTKSVAL